MYRSWKNWWLNLSILIFISRISNVHSKIYYMVSASASIYSNRPYGVVVAIFNSDRSSSCKITLSGPNFSTSMQYNLTPHDHCRSHQFKIPDLKPGEYTLTIESLRGEYFKNSTSINFAGPKMYVKVQTPKTSFRPGDMVRFRVLYFNEQLKPTIPDSSTTVQLFDENDNSVSMFKNLLVRDGIFRGKFKVAKNPVLGRWRICSMQRDREMGECGYFSVLDYVAPPFNMRLQAKRNVAITEKTLLVELQAIYASESPVEGGSILYAESLLDKDSSNQPVKLHLTKRLKNGKSLFTVDLKHFSNEIPNDGPLIILLTAVVNEGYTQDSANTTYQVNLFSSPYLIKCVYTKGFCRTLLPSKENSLSYRITTLEGKTVGTRSVVKLIYSSSEDPKNHTFMSQLNKDGFVNFPRVKLSSTSSHNLSKVVYKTEIEFKGVRQSLPDTSLVLMTAISMRSPPIKVQLPIARVGSSDYIPFEVNHKFDYAVCVTMSNGNVRGGQPIVPDIFGRIEASVDFNADMWPFVHLLLYGMESNTLFISLKTIAIQEARNTISIRAPKKVSPGENLTLNITTVPYSTIGLVAIDEALMGLGDNAANDLNAEQIKMYSKLPVQDAPLEEAFMDLPSQHLGLVTLTNAPSIKNAIPGDGKFRTRTKRSTPSRKRKKGRTTNYRGNFEDVWFFDVFKSNSIGFNVKSFVVPDSITTWRVNAFSMHNTRGLAVLSEPIYIKSSKKLHLTTSLPISIKKYEVLRLPVTCFNQQAKEVDVVLQLDYEPEKMLLLNEDYQNTSNADIEMSIAASNFDVAFYFIKPLVMGVLELNFTAQSETLKDVIQHTLIVKGEVDVDKKYVAIVNSKGDSSTDEDLPLDAGLQQRTVKRVECSVTNQLIALTLKNLPDFQPFDNGETLISKLLSGLYLWDYLSGRELLNSTLSKKFKKYFNDGFQSLLRYKRPDGGFAYYAQIGKSKSSCSSTRLSGFALRALQMLQGTPYLWNNQILHETENFLRTRRRDETHFKERCKTFASTTLSESELATEILEVLEPTQNVTEIEYTHESTKKHSKKTKMNIIKSLNSSQNWLDERKSLARAGSLLLHQKSSHQEQFQVFRWLVSKLYGQSDHVNSYESSMAEHGIYEYLKRNPSRVNNLKVQIDDGKKTIDLDFHQNNDLSVQQLVLQNTVNSVRYRVKGLGQVFLQCGSLYREKDFYDHNRRGDKQRYNLKIVHPTKKNQWNIKFCLQRTKIDRNNYVGSIVELALPSGYVFSARASTKLQKNTNVTQAMAVNGNTKLFVEFRPLPLNTFVCQPILAKIMYKLDNLQPGELMVYDVNAKQQADILTYRMPK